MYCLSSRILADATIETSVKLRVGQAFIRIQTWDPKEAEDDVHGSSESERKKREGLNQSHASVQKKDLEQLCCDISELSFDSYKESRKVRSRVKVRSTLGDVYAPQCGIKRDLVQNLARIALKSCHDSVLNENYEGFFDLGCKTQQRNGQETSFEGIDNVFINLTSAGRARRAGTSIFATCITTGPNESSMMPRATRSASFDIFV